MILLNIKSFYIRTISFLKVSIFNIEKVKYWKIHINTEIRTSEKRQLPPMTFLPRSCKSQQSSSMATSLVELFEPQASLQIFFLSLTPIANLICSLQKGILETYRADIPRHFLTETRSPVPRPQQATPEPVAKLYSDYCKKSKAKSTKNPNQCLQNKEKCPKLLNH